MFQQIAQGYVTLVNDGYQGVKVLHFLHEFGSRDDVCLQRDKVQIDGRIVDGVGQLSSLLAN